MKKKVSLSLFALVVATLLVWFLLGPGAADDVGAQGLMEYQLQLLFGSSNAFVVKAATFFTTVSPESEVTNVWKPTVVSDGCSQWETEGDFKGAEAFVLVWPGNDLLESLGASLQTLLFLEIPPNSEVTLCDRMIHVPVVEDFTISDLSIPLPSP